MKTEAIWRPRTTMEMCELVLRNVFGSVRRLHMFITILPLWPSLLRKTSKEDLQNFDLEKLCEEWQERAPIFYALLLNTASRTNRTWHLVDTPETRKSRNESNCSDGDFVEEQSVLGYFHSIAHILCLSGRSGSEIESEGN